MKYSVITAIFNAESYLSRFIDMFEKIDYDDYEIILINDCSTDHTLQILENWKIETNISLVIGKTEKNGGAGVARNIGLELSSGQYFFFVDADDQVSGEIFTYLDKNIDKSGYIDCLIFDAEVITKRNKRSYLKSLISNEQEGRISKEKAIAFSRGSVCGFVFRNDIQMGNKLHFPEIRRFEDMAFIKVMLSHCDVILYIRKVLYYYIKNSASVTCKLQKDVYKYPIAAFHFMKLNIDKEYHPFLTLQFMYDIIYFCSINMIESNLSDKEIRLILQEQERKLDIYKRYKSFYIKYTSLYVRIVCKLYDKRKFYLLRRIAKIRNMLRAL